MQSIFLVVIAFLFFLLSQASLAILVGHFSRVLALHSVNILKSDKL